MFEKIFAKFKRPEETQEEIVKPVRRELTDEEREIEEERKERAIIDKKIEELDSDTVAKTEEKIRKCFDTEVEADPEDLEEYFNDLDDVRDELTLHSLTYTKDKVLSTLEHRLITKVLEEKLTAIGSSLDAFYEWLENEDELDDEYEDELEEEPSENVRVHYKR